jgi:TonB family protein
VQRADVIDNGFVSGAADYNDAAAAAWVPRRRLAVIAVVGVIHIVTLWAIVAGLRTLPVTRPAPELQVHFISPNLGPKQVPAPPLDWEFQEPLAPLAPEPEIDIAPDRESPGGVMAGAVVQKLAPRLDPDHVNDRPELPRSLGVPISALSLKLLILVLPDGTVSDAKIVKSTGLREIDGLAVDHVKNTWVFIPASINGNPVEGWITVIVRFAPM